ncbi:MAG: HDIG domain-containing protein [Promethearchaeota archaeon]|nr:MAG: HDIG domain-containing protein [Candidatus Lokiarchaeota archaeon]
MVNKEEILPDREFALDLLKRLKIPLSVRRHSEKVADKAIEIANKIKRANIDINLIEIGALLHDIGRTKTHDFKHALIGGKILRQRGFSSKLARICETHILGGLDKDDAKKVGLPEKDYLPITLEEKIICLADKHMAGTREVSIQNRFNRWFQKYGRSTILLKSKKRIEKIQKEIEELI